MAGEFMLDCKKIRVESNLNTVRATVTDPDTGDLKDIINQFSDEDRISLIKDLAIDTDLKKIIEALDPDNVRKIIDEMYSHS